MACIVLLARPITGAILNYRWLSLTITASRMAKTFKRGDHVEWNSEAGRVRGVILKSVVSDVRFKGYVHRATKEEPQYFIKSDKNRPYRNSQRRGPKTSPKQGEEISETGSKESLRAGSASPPLAHHPSEIAVGGSPQEGMA